MKDNNGKAVTWRRNKVLELTSQGNSQVEIASILHVGEATISRDLSHIRQQAQQNLQKHIQQKTPRRISTLSNWNESSLKVKLADC